MPAGLWAIHDDGPRTLNDITAPAGLWTDVAASLGELDGGAE